MKRNGLWTILLLFLVGSLLLGCGGGGTVDEEPTPEVKGSSDFPIKDPGAPFALDEKGTVLFAREAASPPLRWPPICLTFCQNLGVRLECEGFLPLRRRE